MGKQWKIAFVCCGEGTPISLQFAFISGDSDDKGHMRKTFHSIELLCTESKTAPIASLPVQTCLSC